MTYVPLLLFVALISIVTALLAVDLNPPRKEHDRA